MATGLVRDLVRTQDQLGPSDTENLVFKIFDEDMPTVRRTTKLSRQNIGHAFILGHATNGKLGTNNGIDGQQIVLGSGGLGATTISRVVNQDKVFVEALRDDSYVDTANTTATVDTNTFTITF